MKSAKSLMSIQGGDSFAQTDARQGYQLHPLACRSFDLLLINPGCDAQLELQAFLHYV